jgi:hypothetical protein
LRIGRASGAIAASGDIHPDLARRLAREATDTATRVASIAARALDFCPPADIEFGDYLRAVVTADYERAPDDPLGFRGAFIDGFRERGIYAPTAQSMTEEALRWDRWTPRGKAKIPTVKGLVTDPDDPKAGRTNAILLRDFAKDCRNELNLDPALPSRVNLIRAQASQQLDRSGTARTEFKFQIVQRKTVPLDPKAEHSPTFTFRGGSTVVLDGEGTIKYVISKRVDSVARLARMRAHLSDDMSAAAAAGYRPGVVSTRSSLAAMHRGL